MTTFYDDFERGNGALGGNWVLGNGTPVITGGNVSYSSNYLAYNTSVAKVGQRIESTCHINSSSSAGARCGPMVCFVDQSHAYLLHIVGTATPWTLRLTGSGNISSGNIASVSLTTSPPPYYSLRLVYDNGHLSGYLNDVLLLEADDTTNAAGTYGGFAGATTVSSIADCRLVGGSAVQLNVAPSPIGNFGAPTVLTFTGTQTTWTPGTPGSPTFTCDHGTLSGQVVASTTSATATYDPGTYLGMVTFTDPSTGATCAVLVTSNPTVVPVGGIALSQTAIEYIERSAIAETGGTIVNREQQINAFAGLQTLTETITTINAQVTDPGIPAAGIGSLLGFVIEIFDLINGGNNWGGAATVFGNTSLIKSGVDDANTAISDMRGAGGVTLATLAAALSNLRGVGQPSLADLLSAISTPDLGPLSDKLDAMRGDTTTSLYTLLSSLAGIRTVGAYSLGDVREWIGTPAQAKPDATALAVGALLLALLAAPETGGASLAVLAAAEGAGPVLDVATLVELVSVAGELAGIVADIAELKAKPVSGYAGAPVWPGASLVDLGTSVSLGSRGTITEAMDGVLVDIDHADADHKPAYSYDGALAWRNIGCLAFADDQGRLEGYQPFCFANQIFTPKSLRRAASVRWFTGHGPIGTVRAWTVKP